MIEFERMRWYESLLLALPWRRRAYEARLHAAISQLVADPSLPCKIEGTTISHGFGMQEQALLDTLLTREAERLSGPKRRPYSKETDPFRNVPDRY